MYTWYMEEPLILDMPFFSLEYDEKKTCFTRQIPKGAKDLGEGCFSINKKKYVLAQNAENKILAQQEISGRDLIALVRRGYSRLVKSGPVMAEHGNRLMELGLAPGITTFREITAVLRYGKIPKTQWLPIDGLPNHKLYENQIYEIIPDQVSALFSQDKKTGLQILKLRDDEIPLFADTYARLIYIFADKFLYKALAQDNVFIDSKKVSLVLRCESETDRITGKPVCYPVVKYEDNLFSAAALSQHFHHKYLPLKDRWIRRETLERAGIGPLGCYINGESLSPFAMKPADFMAGGSEYLKNLSIAENSGGLEFEKENNSKWIVNGSENDIFSGHLEFLRHWGINGGIIAPQKKAAQMLEAWHKNPALKDARILVLYPENLTDSFSFEKTKQCDILVAVGLDDISGSEDETKTEKIFAILQTIPCRLRLGLFYNPLDRLKKMHADKIRNFFGIKGTPELEKYFIRKTNDFIQFPGECPQQNLTNKNTTVDTDEPYVLGSARFFTQAKFQNLSIAGYREEQDEFLNYKNTGTNNPPQKFIYIEEILSYQSLNENEKNYFCYWRKEFREGRVWEATPAYIYLYARELILRMDSATGEKNFDELYRLWKQYREIFPGALSVFPEWLLEFAIIYNVKILPETFSDILMLSGNDSFKNDSFQNASENSSLVHDLYLHKKYVEENNRLEWKDFAHLASAKKPNRNTGSMEEALNKADGFLRKKFGKKLLEFFCPLPPIKKTIVCFKGLPEMGHSAINAQWLSYNEHKPFLKFLAAPEILGNTDLSNVSDEMEIHDNAQQGGFNNPLPGFHREKIETLRKESNAVMELLSIEKNEEKIEAGNKKPKFKASDFRDIISEETTSEKKDSVLSMKTFLANLDETTTGCLAMLAEGRTNGLDEFARSRNTMAELIIDEINELFMKDFGDLLIENNLDKGPEIQEEYRNEVIWALTSRNV